MGRKENGTIGRGVIVRGLVSATGDLTIEGQVEGRIALADNVLTIGRSGKVEAQVLAKEVNVMGQVDGDISATDTINVHETATVDGALGAPRVGIEEGASFRGHIDIRIPLQKVIKRLKPQRPYMRFLRRLVSHTRPTKRHDEDLGRLFGVAPKAVEATMRLMVEEDSHRRRAS